MVQSFEVLYLAGFGSYRGQMLLADQHEELAPALLPKAYRSQRGFRRLAPDMSRAPVPHEALLGTALYHLDREFALMLLVQMVCYLRPGELTSLTVGQMVSPIGDPRKLEWVVMLAPQESGRPTKTRTFDDSVRIDWDEVPSLGGGSGPTRSGS